METEYIDLSSIDSPARLSPPMMQALSFAQLYGATILTDSPPIEKGLYVQIRG
jgi:hypothetical protein